MTDIHQKLWIKCISTYDLESATLINESSLDKFRRTYCLNDYIYKLVISKFETSSYLRVNDIEAEYNILKEIDNIPGIPSAIIHYKTEEFQVLVMKRLPGELLADLQIGWLRLLTILAKLSIIIFRLARRNINHNDVLPTNVLVAPNGSVSLIDFDQATHSGFWVALIGQFTGINKGINKIHGSLFSILKLHLKKKISPKIERFLRMLLGKDDRQVQSLPTLSENASSQVKALLEAWKLARVSNASSPGAILAYHSFEMNGYKFPGERPWIDRWNVIRTITDYSGKRTLELGCNMALLSCFLLKEAHASAALAVDAGYKILKAAEQISFAFGVKPVLMQENFDDKNDWETSLTEFKPDIVFALSILNWVRDKQRFLTFLGRFNEVIFEGHESFDIESERLRAVGFQTVDIISISERGRQIIYCQK